jgi:Cu2+-containing amine oxidase
VNLTNNKVESNVRLGPNVHGNADYDEILQVEEKTLANEQVKAAIAKLQLPKEAVVCCDPWIYGMFLTFFFFRDGSRGHVCCLIWEFVRLFVGRDWML